MKAVVWIKYGGPDALQLREVDKPLPKAGEVLIKIHATTVTAGDTEVRSLKMPLMLGYPFCVFNGLNKPRKITIMGQELAGKIEALGSEVTVFEAGQRVFGITGFSLGGYAEYICLPAESEESTLSLMPVNMSFEEAAALPFWGLEALHFLREAGIQPGEAVLVNGAGGSIGTFGIQLAKYYGAEVTGVDRADKLEMLRSIGTDHVIEYTREDFTESAATYDVIFDVIGKSPYAGSIKSLRENGCYLLANPRISTMLRGPWTTRSTGKKVVVGTSTQKSADLVFLKELAEAGVLMIVIDRRYKLEDTADAHKYVETGAKKGNLIITVLPESGK
jgi:NADPH:quinone reductase-like Zn-dependent oxidoreductase